MQNIFLLTKEKNRNKKGGTEYMPSASSSRMKLRMNVSMDECNVTK
jgi:hypothetical protein